MVQTASKQRESLIFFTIGKNKDVHKFLLDEFLIFPFKPLVYPFKIEMSYPILNVS